MFKAHDVFGVIAGIFILIAIYLVLTHGTAANGLTSTTAASSVGLIKTLQGR